MPPTGSPVGPMTIDTPRGVSMVIGPTGEPVGGMKRDDEGVLYADVDTSAAVEPKQFHDVVGHYNRFDVFGLTVNRTRLRPARFVGDEPMPPAAEDDARGLPDPGR